MKIGCVVAALCVSSLTNQVQAESYKSQIQTIARNSKCATVSWLDRGKAPVAYLEGMAITFAKSLCRRAYSQNAGVLMASRNSGNVKNDAFEIYRSKYKALGYDIDKQYNDGRDDIRSLYTLGIGLGMRESSGKYCTGRDTTNDSSNKSETAEAGLFQSSYNVITGGEYFKHSELREIYNAYKKDQSKCFLEVFSKNVTCKNQAIVGSGEGATYQKLAKSCPAFATELAMASLRVIPRHYGPIRDLEAELGPVGRKDASQNGSCNKMLEEVQDLYESRAANVCAELI